VQFLIVITACSRRKCGHPSSELVADALPAGPLDAVAREWGQRLGQAKPIQAAKALYQGRAFREAEHAAGRLQARLHVASAGLGLLGAETRVPSYACTINPGLADSIAPRIRGDWSARSWWGAIMHCSPFATPLRDVVRTGDGLILVALPETYLDMLGGDLVALTARDRARLRIFTRASPLRLAADLGAQTMPYDARLDGPDSENRGTIVDFASRALAHFVGTILVDGDQRDATAHSEAVMRGLENWRLPLAVARDRRSDEEIVSLMHSHWEAAGRSATRLLRMFRDDLKIACEQERFARLARKVRQERA
jgi:hypothetical protein